MPVDIWSAGLPWALTALASWAALVVLFMAAGPVKWNPSRLLDLAHDEQGAVQSLSFVLTLPVFIMLLMLIVQSGLLSVATMAVHYAAYAAARSAVVWIPANVDSNQGIEIENQVGVVSAGGEEEEDGIRYRIAPSGPKYDRIRSAAVLACASIAPSRDLGFDGGSTAAAVERVYALLDPASSNNGRIPRRLRNKIGYSLQNTEVELSFWHRNDEPMLLNYAIRGDLPSDVDEFHPNEIGWQDSIRVEVTHNYALLPGPARLLSRSPNGGDSITARILSSNGVYTTPLRASAELGNEGQKSVLPYFQVR